MTRLMYRDKPDNKNITEAFNDFQEKLGMIKKVAVPGKTEWEATIFSKKIKRLLPSKDQAIKFIEDNY